MYKKLLFLLVALPLTHSTMYSGEWQQAPKNAFNACGGILGCGAIAVTLACAKERSMDKEIILPIMAASFMGMGVSKASSLTFNLCKRLTAIMNFSKISNFFNKLNNN